MGVMLLLMIFFFVSYFYLLGCRYLTRVVTSFAWALVFAVHLQDWDIDVLPEEV